MAAKKVEEEPGTTLATVDDLLAAAQGMTTKATAATLGRAFEGMIVEEIVKIEEGQTMQGIFLGAGGATEVADPQTGEIRPLGTWRIQHPKNPQIVALVLDCAKLRRFFGGIPVGSRVTLYRRGAVRSAKGRVVNDYLCAHVPPAKGDVIDVQAAQ